MHPLTHAQIWSAIDALAARHGLTPSGLARRAGLDPTTFNKSKRGEGAKLRWPSTESIAKVLTAVDAGLEEFVALTLGEGVTLPRSTIPLIGMAEAGSGGFFDDAGFPAGGSWEEIGFPEFAEPHAYALEVSGEAMMPVYRDGDRIIVAPGANVRRGDRVVVKTLSGEVLVKQVLRLSANRVELRSFNTSYPDRVLALKDLAFMHRIVWASQ